MKFDIGSRVRWLDDLVVKNRYIVMATKEQKLDTEFLRSREIDIYKIEVMAENGIEVTGGFDYKICKENDQLREGLCELTGPFIPVFEDSLEW